MNLTRKLLAFGLAMVFGVETIAAPHVVLPPSPPPCSPDKGCLPKRVTWGHYETRWRTWPGVDPRTPTPAVPEGSDVLPPFDAPARQDEDQQAPPPLETEDAENGEEDEDLPVDTPPLSLPPLPFPSSPPTTEPGTTTPEDSPPPLPFERPFSQPPTTPPQPPSTFRPLPGTPPNRPAPNNGQFGPQGRRLPQPGPATQPVMASEQDAPPTLPMNFTRRLPQPTEPQVSRFNIPPRRLPFVAAHPTASVVVPAGATTGERPRALPAVYTPASDPPPVLPAFGK